MTRDGGRPFPRIETPRLVRDDPELVEAESKNPRAFDVEFNAQWLDVNQAFLDERHVQRAFEMTTTGPLVEQAEGRLDTIYAMHIDPARRNARFAAVIAHRVQNGNDHGMPHLHIDRIMIWDARHFTGGEIDQYAVVEQLLHYIKTFCISTITVDQYDAPLITQYLEARTGQLRLGWRITTQEVPATAARNWHQATRFQEALSLGLIHSYPHDLAKQELLHLQLLGQTKVGPPTAGAITTGDIADYFFALTDQLIGDDLDRFRQMGEAGLHATHLRHSHEQDIFARMGNPRGDGDPQARYDPARGSRFDLRSRRRRRGDRW